MRDLPELSRSVESENRRRQQNPEEKRNPYSRGSESEGPVSLFSLKKEF